MGQRAVCLQPPLPFSSWLLILPFLASQVLYQGLEKLEKEKVNRGHLEMEIEVVRARLRALLPGGQRWRGARRVGGEGGFRLRVRVTAPGALHGPLPSGGLLLSPGRRPTRALWRPK